MNIHVWGFGFWMMKIRNRFKRGRLHVKNEMTIPFVKSIFDGEAK